MPQQEAGSRSDKLLSHQKVYITRRILIVRRISPERCSKSYIALFLSNTHLRSFYSLVNYRYHSLLSSINPQFFHKLIGPSNTWIHTISPSIRYELVKPALTGPSHLQAHPSTGTRLAWCSNSVLETSALIRSQGVESRIWQMIGSVETRKKWRNRKQKDHHLEELKRWQRISGVHYHTREQKFSPQKHLQNKARIDLLPTSLTLNS